MQKRKNGSIRLIKGLKYYKSKSLDIHRIWFTGAENKLCTKLTECIFINIPRVVLKNSAVDSVAKLSIHGDCNLVRYSNEQVHKVAPFPNDS